MRGKIDKIVTQIIFCVFWFRKRYVKRKTMRIPFIGNRERAGTNYAMRKQISRGWVIL